MTCPHPGLQVQGKCYFCLKVAATNGHRSKLSVEQLAFVGFCSHTEQTDQPRNHGPFVGWLQPVNPRTIDDRLDSVASLMDWAPNYLALAKEILNEK